MYEKVVFNKSTNLDKTFPYHSYFETKVFYFREEREGGGPLDNIYPELPTLHSKYKCTMTDYTTSPPRPKKSNFIKGAF